MTTLTKQNETANCDDWTKIAMHCLECGAQFFRKVKGQRHCDEHRHLAGSQILPKEALTSKKESPLRQYFRLRPTIVDDEPNAQRIEFKVGVQTFSVGPEYVEDKDHGQWFIDMLIIAMQGAFSGLCNTCYGRGYTEEGDPETGSVPETCKKCDGKGKLSANPSAPETGVSEGGDAVECVLRVEITSDTFDKVESFCRELCNLILDAPAANNADVMVTIHGAPGPLPVFETNRQLSPVETNEHSVKGLASAGSSAAVNPRDNVGGSAEPSGRPAGKVVDCGNPVMVNAEWYGPCTRPSGHDGDCSRAQKASADRSEFQCDTRMESQGNVYRCTSYQGHPGGCQEWALEPAAAPTNECPNCGPNGPLGNL